MYPFLGPEDRRVLGAEIADLIARRLGATVTLGFDATLDVGDAEVGGERIAGFQETHDLREVLLRLSARRPLTWRSAPVPGTDHPRVCFVLSLGFGNGSPLPQPSGQWGLTVNGRLAVACRVVNHSQLWRGDSCSLAFTAARLESAAPFTGMTLSSLIVDEAFATFGPALLTVPTQWLEAGKPAVLSLVPRPTKPSRRWVALAAPGPVLEGADIASALGLLTEGPPTACGFRVYFGDIHTHSGQVRDECADRGCGIGSREDNYAFARGAGGLDFYALTDHEWQIDPDDPGGYFGLADAHTEDGRFVALPAYEFTNRLWGHRNVYFGESGGRVVSASRDDGPPHGVPEQTRTPGELWAALEADGVPFLTVPHHPSAASHPLTWERFHPVHDRLVEVYSVWGSSEYYGDFPRGVSDRYRYLGVREALARGLRFGLIASADGHDGHPGDAQSPLVKHHHQFHFCGSGRVAVLAETLTRAAVFEALYCRRCYATTGPPIVLDVSLNGAPMGSELPAEETARGRRLRVAVRGTNGIREIRITRNGRVVETIACHGAFEEEREWEDRTDPSEPASYYVRVVQVDRESAWSSPIWVG